MSKQKEYRVYVIELDSAVMVSGRWAIENQKQTSESCYYVGQSLHSPQCRYRQHTTPRGDSCLCLCGFEPGKEIRKLHVGRAKYAKDHSIRLRPDLYEHLDPFETREDAKEAEGSLARQLRNEGHGVCYG